MLKIYVNVMSQGGFYAQMGEICINLHRTKFTFSQSYIDYGYFNFKSILVPKNQLSQIQVLSLILFRFDWNTVFKHHLKTKYVNISPQGTAYAKTRKSLVSPV